MCDIVFFLGNFVGSAADVVGKAVGFTVTTASHVAGEGVQACLHMRRALLEIVATFQAIFCEETVAQLAPSSMMQERQVVGAVAEQRLPPVMAIEDNLVVEHDLPLAPVAVAGLMPIAADNDNDNDKNDENDMLLEEDTASLSTRSSQSSLSSSRNGPISKRQQKRWNARRTSALVRGFAGAVTPPVKGTEGSAK